MRVWKRTQIISRGNSSMHSFPTASAPPQPPPGSVPVRGVETTLIARPVHRAFKDRQVSFQKVSLPLRTAAIFAHSNIVTYLFKHTFFSPRCVPVAVTGGPQGPRHCCTGGAGPGREAASGRARTEAVRPARRPGPAAGGRVPFTEPPRPREGRPGKTPRVLVTVWTSHASGAFRPL